MFSIGLSERLAPNSPDLNPVDCGIWEMSTEKVYKNNIRNVEHLQEVIVQIWEEIAQNKVDNL